MSGGDVGDDGGDLIFFNEHKSKVGLHFEHVVFVRYDHAIKFLAVFETNFIRLRRLGEERDRQDSAGQEKRAARNSHVFEYAADRKVVATTVRDRLSARLHPVGVRVGLEVCRGALEYSGRLCHAELGVSLFCESATLGNS